MNAIELIKFVTSHPEHLATITKIIDLLRADPTLVSDLVKLLQTVGGK